MIGPVFGPKSRPGSEHHRKDERITDEEDDRMNYGPQKPAHRTHVTMFQVAQDKVLNKVAIGRELSPESNHQCRLYRTNFPF